MKKKKEKPAISVVVPFYDAEQTLQLCLEAIEAQTVKPGEIIMVDNGSTDESADIAKAFFKHNPKIFKYVLEKKKGPSSARNRGVSESQGDIIAFTDSDCIPDQNWLRNLMVGFNDPKIGAVAGKIEGYNPKNAADKLHSLFTMTGLSEHRIYKGFTLVKGGFPTANLAVRKDVIGVINGFDEGLKISAEDFDLCARIYRAGYYISYTPEAIVYHQHRNSIVGTWRQGLGFGKGHAILLKRHFGKMVVLDLPRFHYQSREWPLRMWLDMQGADKKVVGLMLLAFLWWPFWLLLISYFIYLFLYMRSKLKEHNFGAGFFEKWQMVFILLTKSAAITMGRIIGSLRNRVMCL